MNLKKIISTAAIIPLLLTVGAGAQSAVRTIPVRTLDELLKVGKHSDDYPLKNVVYELAGAIDASATCGKDGKEPEFVFEPIGTMDKQFTGTFKSTDGKTFVISNLCVNMPDSGHVGLFGVIGAGGTVRNVGLDAAKITGSYAVGTLAGTNYGTVERTFGKGEVNASRGESNAGGLVGVNGGLITVSYSEASVNGKENVGGLVGLLTNVPAGVGRLFRTYAAGDVKGGSWVGGLAGRIFGGEIEESHYAGGSKVGLIGDDFFVTSTSYRVRGAKGDAKYITEAPLIRCYWDMQKSGVTASSFGGSGVIGNTTEQMKTLARFTGWDFPNTWVIPPKDYPHFEREGGIIPDHTPFVWTFNYDVDNADCGRLRVTVNGITADMYSSAIEAVPGMSYQVVAMPWELEHGCKFVGWSDGAADSVRVDEANVNVTAKFIRDDDRPPRRLIYVAENDGMILMSGIYQPFDYLSDMVTRGERGPFVAVKPDLGMRFVAWEERDVEGKDTNIVRVDIATDVSPRRFTAKFEEDTRSVITISSYDELNKIGNKEAGFPLDGVYELDSDIDASGNFIPIGTPESPFGGVFRGNGYVISGLRVDRPNDDFAGLFGYADKAVISGVYLVNANIVGRNNVGALVGRALNTVIDSCAAVGSAGQVRGVGSVGGLAGSGLVTLIHRSYSTVSVTGSGRGVGGLVGTSGGSMISGNYASGLVKGGGASGGLIGEADFGMVQFSYAAGSVAGDGAPGAGGLIGMISGGVRILQCYSAGSVEGMALGTGGLIGKLGTGGGRVTESYWDTESSGQLLSSGGIAKSTDDMKSKNTYTKWDFHNAGLEDPVWGIADSYPYLLEIPPGAEFGGVPKLRFTAAKSSVKPTARIVGRNLHINAPSGSSLQIRLVDMRGRQIARYDVKGGAKIPLSTVPAGRYIVDMRENGKRSGASPVRVVK